MSPPPLVACEPLQHRWHDRVIATKLLIAMFDRLQQDLGTAIAAIGRDDVEASHKSLLNAQDLVYELNMALDTDAWSGARELRAIYQHLMELMIEANLQKDLSLITACQEIVDPLADSWRAAYQTLQAQKLDLAMSDLAEGAFPMGVACGDDLEVWTEALDSFEQRVEEFRAVLEPEGVAPEGLWPPQRDRRPPVAAGVGGPGSGPTEALRGSGSRAASSATTATEASATSSAASS